MNDQTTNHWIVIPAAGAGQRMGAELPKQYLPLANSTVLATTLQRLTEGIDAKTIVVALSPNDEYWPSINKPVTPILVTTGGQERCHSVLNGLYALRNKASDNDWVWVHDAARPCVRVSDLTKLKKAIQDHEVGGLLAAKLTDTVKQASEDQSFNKTIDRSHLWRALTPQVFRYNTLLHALEQAIEAGQYVTDEAQAIEQQGLSAKLVECHADNIKITKPGDLELAEFYLKCQQTSP